MKGFQVLLGPKLQVKPWEGSVTGKAKVDIFQNPSGGRQKIWGIFFVLNEFQKQPPEVFYKKDVLENFTIFTKKTLVQMFSCEFCEICNSIFSAGHLWTTACGVWFPKIFIFSTNFLILTWMSLVSWENAWAVLQ